MTVQRFSLELMICAQNNASMLERRLKRLFRRCKKPRIAVIRWFDKTTVLSNSRQSLQSSPPAAIEPGSMEANDHPLAYFWLFF